MEIRAELEQERRAKIEELKKVSFVVGFEGDEEKFVAGIGRDNLAEKVEALADFARKRGVKLEGDDTSAFLDKTKALVQQEVVGLVDKDNLNLALAGASTDADKTKVFEAATEKMMAELGVNKDSSVGQSLREYVVNGLSGEGESEENENDKLFERRERFFDEMTYALMGSKEAESKDLKKERSEARRYLRETEGVNFDFVDTDRDDKRAGLRKKEDFKAAMNWLVSSEEGKYDPNKANHYLEVLKRAGVKLDEMGLVDDTGKAVYREQYEASIQTISQAGEQGEERRVDTPLVVEIERTICPYCGSEDMPAGKCLNCGAPIPARAQEAEEARARNEEEQRKAKEREAKEFREYAAVLGEYDRSDEGASIDKMEVDIAVRYLLKFGVSADQLDTKTSTEVMVMAQNLFFGTLLGGEESSASQFRDQLMLARVTADSPDGKQIARDFKREIVGELVVAAGTLGITPEMAGTSVLFRNLRSWAYGADVNKYGVVVEMDPRGLEMDPRGLEMAVSNFYKELYRSYTSRGQMTNTFTESFNDQYLSKGLEEIKKMGVNGEEMAARLEKVGISLALLHDLALSINSADAYNENFSRTAGRLSADRLNDILHLVESTGVGGRQMVIKNLAALDKIARDTYFRPVKFGVGYKAERTLCDSNGRVVFEKGRVVANETEARYLQDRVQLYEPFVMEKVVDGVRVVEKHLRDEVGGDEVFMRIAMDLYRVTGGEARYAVSAKSIVEKDENTGNVYATYDSNSQKTNGGFFRAIFGVRRSWATAVTKDPGGHATLRFNKEIYAHADPGILSYWEASGKGNITDTNLAVDEFAGIPLRKFVALTEEYLSGLTFVDTTSYDSLGTWMAKIGKVGDTMVKEWGFISGPTFNTFLSNIETSYWPVISRERIQVNDKGEWLDSAGHVTRDITQVKITKVGREEYITDRLGDLVDFMKVTKRMTDEAISIELDKFLEAGKVFANAEALSRFMIRHNIPTSVVQQEMRKPQVAADVLTGRYGKKARRKAWGSILNNAIESAKKMKFRP